MLQLESRPGNDPLVANFYSFESSDNGINTVKYKPNVISLNWFRSVESTANDSGS